MLAVYHKPWLKKVSNKPQNAIRNVKLHDEGLHQLISLACDHPNLKA